MAHLMQLTDITITLQRQWLNFLDHPKYNKWTVQAGKKNAKEQKYMETTGNVQQHLQVESVKQYLLHTHMEDKTLHKYSNTSRV